jgi:Zn ribbon nucleic-acid-binding protein
MWTIRISDPFSVKMGRPKRKLSPLKSDLKVRKLSAFGFCKDRELQSDSAENTVDVNNGEICSYEERQSDKSVEVKLPKQNEKIIRKFRPEWKHTRDWLEYDAKNKLMFCTVCRNAKMVNSFVSGCSSLKIENIRSHENPKGKKVGKLIFRTTVDLCTPHLKNGRVM